MVVQNRTLPQVRQPQRTVLDAFMRKNPSYAEALIERQPQFDAFQARTMEAIHVQCVAAMNAQPRKWDFSKLPTKMFDALWASAVTATCVAATVPIVVNEGIAVAGAGSFLGGFFTVVGGVLVGDVLKRPDFPLSAATLRGWGMTSAAAIGLVYCGAPLWAWLASVAGVGVAASTLVGSDSLFPAEMNQRSSMKAMASLAQRKLPQLNDFMTDTASAMTYLLGVESPQRLQSDVVPWVRSFLRQQDAALQSCIDTMVLQREQIVQDLGVVQGQDAAATVDAKIEHVVVAEVAGKAVHKAARALDHEYLGLHTSYVAPTRSARLRLGHIAADLDRLIIDYDELAARLATARQYAAGFDEAALRAPLDARFERVKKSMIHLLDAAPWYESTALTTTTP